MSRGCRREHRLANERMKTRSADENFQEVSYCLDRRLSDQKRDPEPGEKPRQKPGVKRNRAAD